MNTYQIESTCTRCTGSGLDPAHGSYCDCCDGSGGPMLRQPARRRSVPAGLLILAAAVLSLALGSQAEARMPKDPDPVPAAGGPVTATSASNSAAVADATQLQGQAQRQAQEQAQAQQQAAVSEATGGSATGGDASAVGTGIGHGGGGGGGGGGGSSAVTMTGARQVGMLYLPTMIPPSCGAAITAGHGNTRNVTAGGISWTTERCWSVLIAADYERMGAYREACELRRDVVRKQARRARINIDCERIERDMRAAIAAAAIVPPSEPSPDYATREELRRAFEAAAGKAVK